MDLSALYDIAAPILTGVGGYLVASLASGRKIKLKDAAIVAAEEAAERTARHLNEIIVNKNSTIDEQSIRLRKLGLQIAEKIAEDQARAAQRKAAGVLGRAAQAAKRAAEKAGL